MSKSDEIKRLNGLGLSHRAIARSLKIHRNTVKKYLEEQVQIVLPEPAIEPSWVDSLPWDELIGEAGCRISGIVYRPISTIVYQSIS